MSWDLGRLRVRKVIVHEVPQRFTSGDGAPPILSEIDSPLTTELRNYFRERIAISLRTGAYEVIFVPDTTSPVPGLVASHLRGVPPGFVALSQTLARHLHTCQTGINPTGLLVVIDVRLEDHAALAILKLEKEEGIRVHQSRHEGKSTFDIQHLKDLMLTEQTRVFKVGLFRGDGTKLDSVEGLVSDKQRGYQPRTEVADFFLKKFLGCMLREAPSITTKRFFELTETFINDSVDDPALKAQYQIALLADLASQDGAVSPARFATQALRVEHRAAYLAHLAQHTLAEQQFEKDLTLVASHLRRLQVDFDSGILVLAPPPVFDQHVSMTNLEDGRTRLQIEDRIKRIHGKR